MAIDVLAAALMSAAVDTLLRTSMSKGSTARLMRSNVTAAALMSVAADTLLRTIIAEHAWL